MGRGLLIWLLGVPVPVIILSAKSKKTVLALIMRSPSGGELFATHTTAGRDLIRGQVRRPYT